MARQLTVTIELQVARRLSGKIGDGSYINNDGTVSRSDNNGSPTTACGSDGNELVRMPSGCSRDDVRRDRQIDQLPIGVNIIRKAANIEGYSPGMVYLDMMFRGFSRLKITVRISSMMCIASTVCCGCFAKIDGEDLRHA